MTESFRAWALLAVAAASLITNIVVTWHEAGTADFGSLLYASLAPFAAAYQPVGDQSQRPSQVMAFAMSASFLTTVAAVVSAYLTLTRDTRSQWLASRRSEAFVVFGGGDEAETIAESARETYGRTGVVRVLPPNETDPFPFVASVHWPNVLHDKRVMRLVERAGFVVVATANDAVNSSLAADVREAFPSAQVNFLLGSSALSRALRPPVIEGELPAGGAFSIGENVAQFVATVVASHSRATGSAVRVAVETRDGERDLRKSIAAWLRDADRAQALVTETQNARIHVVEHLSEANVVVVVGQPPEVAVRVLKGIRSGLDGPRLIAVLPPDLLASSPRELKQVERAEDWLRSSTGREIPPSLVVDPAKIGLHHRFVTEGPAVLWGRAYQQAAGLVLGDGADWNFDEPGRQEQLSITAAQFMVRQLGTYGYRLVQAPPTDAVWDAPTDLVETLAGELHDVLRFPGRNLGGRMDTHVGFEQLDDAAKDSTRRLVMEVYPAMAAMLGYRIRDSSQPS